LNRVRSIFLAAPKAALVTPIDLSTTWCILRLIIAFRVP
jgi:hypothetical protein